jgi:hypothetical protein
LECGDLGLALESDAFGFVAAIGFGVRAWWNVKSSVEELRSPLIALLVKRILKK